MSGMPQYRLDARADVVEFAPGWELVVGLEVHTELLTVTKLFCRCRNDFGGAPNRNTCPVCLGLPGSLPVVNRRAVEFAIRIGLALNCQVQSSIFHRKNYFYPDMPKDYQISQYDVPINAKGYLTLPSGARIGIERAHIEEDTGKIVHRGGGGRIASSDASLIDYNRSGIPLVEIVSSPDIATPEQAREYVSELRAVLIAIGASDGKMEEGSLRVDANVSVRPTGSAELRTRCEIKNVNSLRSLGRAITYEAERQIALYEKGEAPLQQTRYWDEAKGVTGALRSKEEAEDYRYFPEPDLVPLAPSDGWIAEIRSSLPMLPSGRRSYLLEKLAMSATNDQVETALAEPLFPFVHEALERGVEPRVAVARAANELASLQPIPDSLDVDRFVTICLKEAKGEVTATQAKALISKAAESEVDIEELIRTLGFERVDDSALRQMVEGVVGAHPEEWARFVGGEAQLRGFFVGAVMKASSGKADGKAVAAVLGELAARG
ncbi:MAG: Asp-tRNA(Asn)/Glu-tRNA(Gln) amidotransferase subunit GatB [Acidimicrobiales bacterium]